MPFDISVIAFVPRYLRSHPGASESAPLPQMHIRHIYTEKTHRPAHKQVDTQTHTQIIQGLQIGERPTRYRRNIIAGQMSALTARTLTTENSAIWRPHIHTGSSNSSDRRTY